jgi:hypothetical protein
MIDPIIGRRELGKTTLARYMAASVTPAIVIDPRRQWPIDDPESVMVDVDYDRALARLELGQSVILQPRNKQRAIDELADVAQTWIIDEDANHDRALSIVFDEAGLYRVNAYDYLFRCSPRARSLFLLTAHRPADIATDVRSLADTWCLFRMTQEHDLDVIEERCGRAVRDRVTTLPPYHFVIWDDAKAEMSVHTEPSIWKTPAARPLVGTPISAPSVRHLWER